MESPTDSATITIPLSRLRELELLESRIPAMVEAAVAAALEQKKRERLSKLVGDPAEHAKRQLEKYHNNRDAINARRRAAYKAKKATKEVDAF